MEVVGVFWIYDILMLYFMRGIKIIIGLFLFLCFGEGFEFYVVREYRLGDLFKIINWKVMVRIGEIMVNEFESERKVDVVFVVDVFCVNVFVLDY